MSNCIYRSRSKPSRRNEQRSIYQYSKMAPRLSGQNCNFLKFPLSHDSKKRLGYKENSTKYRRLSWKPQRHVRIWYSLAQSNWGFTIPVIWKLFKHETFVSSFQSDRLAYLGSGRHSLEAFAVLKPKVIAGISRPSPLTTTRGGYSQKNWVGVCGPLLRTLTLSMTKICDIPNPI